MERIARSLPQANIDLQFDPEIQAELERHLDILKHSKSYYRSWCLMRMAGITGEMTVKYEAGRVKHISPKPYFRVED